MPDCANSKQTRYTDGDGNVYEVFWLDGELIFENGIRNMESWTRTPPGWVLHDNGYCTWESEPPPRPWLNTEPQQHINTESIKPQPTPPEVQASRTPQNTEAQGVASLFFLTAMIGGCVWLYLRSKKQDGQTDPDYHPMSDLPRLPRLSELAGRGADESIPESNQTHGILGEFDPEFDPNSTEFDPNSTPAQAYEEFSGAWPPTAPEPLYDPLQPEQQSEFDDYRRILQKHGLSPNGNEIIYLLWGAKPGNSSKYKAALRRRQQFSRRLDYYRSEGA